MKDTNYHEHSAKCSYCLGSGCKFCNKKGWVNVSHPRALVCATSNCSNVVHPSRLGLFCSSSCADMHESTT